MVKIFKKLFCIIYLMLNISFYIVPFFFIRPCLGGQLNTNQSSNHQVWTDQTWPPPHNCQDTKCSHYGNNRGCMTTASCCNGKGSLTDTLDKNQFLYPNWAAATGAPHMWQQYSAYGALCFYNHFTLIALTNLLVGKIMSITIHLRGTFCDPNITILW